MNARSLAITRAVAVIGGTGALIAAATFAAVSTTSPVTISGISLASSDVNVLQIYDFNANTFANDTSQPSVNGSSIDLALTPTDSAKQAFYLKNLDASSALALSAHVSANGTGGLDPANVQVTLWDDSAAPVQLAQDTLANFETNNIPLANPAGNLAASAQGDSSNRGTGHNGNYQVSFKLINPATGFDQLTGVTLQFTGTPTP